MYIVHSRLTDKLSLISNDTQGLHNFTIYRAEVMFEPVKVLKSNGSLHDVTREESMKSFVQTPAPKKGDFMIVFKDGPWLLRRVYRTTLGS